ncbi:MAG: nucleoside monophosphate kinase, partial [Patescibacteria group bacterium]
MVLKNSLLNSVFDKGPVIILIGQSGSGKQTQSKALIEASKELNPERGVYIAETGQIWRDSIPQMTPFCKNLLDQIQSAGQLQSWVTTTSLWGSKFFHEYNGGLIIVDGSPRSLGEAQALFDFYYGFARKEIIIFSLDISDEESEKRMVSRNDALVKAGGIARSDTDTPEKRKTKIAYFHTDVKPAI